MNKNELNELYDLLGNYYYEIEDKEENTELIKACELIFEKLENELYPENYVKAWSIPENTLQELKNEKKFTVENVKLQVRKIWNYNYTYDKNLYYNEENLKIVLDELKKDLETISIVPIKFETKELKNGKKFTCNLGKNIYFSFVVGNSFGKMIVGGVVRDYELTQKLENGSFKLLD